MRTCVYGRYAPVIVFKSINNYPPEYLRDLFRLRGNIKNLRGVNKLQVPKPNTYILLDVLLCSIAEYFYELCRILASP